MDGKTFEMMYAAWPFNSRPYWIATVADSPEDLILPAPLTDEQLAKAMAENDAGATSAEVENDTYKPMYAVYIDAVTGDRVSIANYTIAASESDEGRIVTMTPIELEKMQYTETAEAAPFKEIAWAYAQKHFNHSEVVSVEFESISVQAKDGQYQEAYSIGKDTPYPFTMYDKGRSISFNVTDDTGRTALVTIYIDTAQVIGVDTQNSDFIPGYNADAPGAVG